jgi:hypothetical protein
VWRVAVVLGVPISSLVPEPLTRKRPHASVVSVLNPRRRVSNTSGHVSDRAIFSPATNFTGARSHAAALDEDDAG